MEIKFLAPNFYFMLISLKKKGRKKIVYTSVESSLEPMKPSHKVIAVLELVLPIPGSKCSVISQSYLHFTQKVNVGSASPKSIKTSGEYFVQLKQIIMASS